MKPTHFFLSLISIAISLSAAAEITPGPLVGNSMVLQQNSQVSISGWSDRPDAVVTLKASWDKRKYRTRADSEGYWKFILPTPAASLEPQTLEISDGDPLTIKDVLIGEVWLASGQSNMEQPLHGFEGCPVENSAEYIAESGRYKGRMHFCTVNWEPSPEPKRTVGTQWKDCTPATARDFCAVAYFFGKRLTETLDCPVGLVNASVGATRVEGWTPKEIVSGYPGEVFDSEEYLNCDKVTPAEDVERSLPCVFYNGMIHPLIGYTIKGFLWYQGEANADKPELYADRFETMVRCWRNLWGLGDLPFYYVEICPFEYYWLKDKSTVPLLREAQYKVSERLPAMGMVCTNDLVRDYEYWQIHPSMKKEVGDRLCFWALSRTYGIDGIDCTYPVYRSMEVDGGVVTLSFDCVEDGFNRNVGIEGFEICGEDRVWHKPTRVGRKEKQITVKCDEVPAPVAVRYCFKSWQPGNLKSNSGLPVIPFRTDDWER